VRGIPESLVNAVLCSCVYFAPSCHTRKGEAWERMSWNRPCTANVRRSRLRGEKRGYEGLPLFADYGVLQLEVSFFQPFGVLLQQTLVIHSGRLLASKSGNLLPHLYVVGNARQPATRCRL
jgi:hypothetical protein